MTYEEAIAKAETGWWKTATPREIVAFQLYEPLLCMDFGDFHGAMEKALGRPVWTHEFAGAGLARLQEEFEGVRSKPTMNEIVEQLPAEKVVVIECP